MGDARWDEDEDEEEQSEEKTVFSFIKTTEEMLFGSIETIQPANQPIVNNLCHTLIRIFRISKSTLVCLLIDSEKQKKSNQSSSSKKIISGLARKEDSQERARDYRQILSFPLSR